MPKCKSCGQEIRWVVTFGGTNIPINIDEKSKVKGNPVLEVFDAKTMTSHFAVCPQAKEWRKK